MQQRASTSRSKWPIDLNDFPLPLPNSGNYLAHLPLGEVASYKLLTAHGPSACHTLTVSMSGNTERRGDHVQLNSQSGSGTMNDDDGRTRPECNNASGTRTEERWGIRCKVIVVSQSV